MAENIRSLLEKEMISEFKCLENLEPGSPEQTAVIENLIKLYKAKLDEDNAEAAKSEKLIMTREANIDRYVKIGIVAFEVLAPIVFYGIWMNRGFEYEKTGGYSSTTFRGLFSHFRPTKK